MPSVTTGSLIPMLGPIGKRFASSLARNALMGCRAEPGGGGVVGGHGVWGGLAEGMAYRKGDVLPVAAFHGLAGVCHGAWV